MEWIETAYDGINNTAEDRRELRGGSWYNISDDLDASNPDGVLPTRIGFETSSYGFRVAAVGVPEPSTGLLVVLGLSGLLLKRRKTGTL